MPTKLLLNNSLLAHWHPKDPDKRDKRGQIKINGVRSKLNRLSLSHRSVT